MNRISSIRAPLDPNPDRERCIDRHNHRPCQGIRRGIGPVLSSTVPFCKLASIIDRHRQLLPYRSCGLESQLFICDIIRFAGLKHRRSSLYHHLTSRRRNRVNRSMTTDSGRSRKHRIIATINRAHVLCIWVYHRQPYQKW